MERPLVFRRLRQCPAGHACEERAAVPVHLRHLLAAGRAASVVWDDLRHAMEDLAAPAARGEAAELLLLSLQDGDVHVVGDVAPARARRRPLDDLHVELVRLLLLRLVTAWLADELRLEHRLRKLADG
eukprot:1779969-Prymnesium_polylepis.1